MTGDDSRAGQTPQPVDSEAGAEAQELDLIDVITVLLVHKRLLVVATLVAAAVSLAASLLIPNKYHGVATLLPPQEDSSVATAILGSIVNPTSVAGGGLATALGLKNSNDLYVGLLKSRTVADRLIERFKLQEVYGQETLVETREDLEEHTSINAGQDGLIRIEFEDVEPGRAADVANAYVEELEALTARTAISEASRRRLYFERKVEETKTALANSDAELKRVQERTGLIKLDEQARAIFATVATLKAQILAKEVELHAIGSFATRTNPEYIRVQAELTGLRKQLVGLERSNALGSGDILIPIEKVPAVGQEYLEKWRDVKYNETVYELLARQLEIAKIDEGKNSTLIQLVDRAIPPDKKSAPRRGLIVAISSVLVLLLCTVVLLARELLARVPEGSVHLKRLQRLRAHLTR
jgi:uncharacterized protein involved in exopolysaccharide biosynthesis